MRNGSHLEFVIGENGITDVMANYYRTEYNLY